MHVKSITVENFHSIHNETLLLDNITILVGANGSGKSSFLMALELFKSVSPKITIDDFYNKNTDEPITITICFDGLSQDENKQFIPYIQNGELTVSRIFRFVVDHVSNDYYGKKLQNPDFSIIRDLKLTLKDIRGIYTEYILPKYPSFKQTITGKPELKKILELWESDNIDKCKLMLDDGKFFGFNEAAQGYLGRYIDFLYVEAFKDMESVTSDEKRSPLSALIDLVVRHDLMGKTEIQDMVKQFRVEIDEFLNENSSSMSELSTSLTKKLKDYVPEAEVKLTLKNIDFNFNKPYAEISLMEDEYESKVENTGHGIQRLFIMTILEYLSTFVKKTDDSITEYKTYVLIIDEPELYQHPNRARYISKFLLKLSSNNIENSKYKIQIIYATHSAYFIDIDRIKQIRILQKEKRENYPKITKIFSINSKDVLDKLKCIYSRSIDWSNIKTGLRILNIPLFYEGFFSKGVVLVEGSSDRLAIIESANISNINFESNNISVIPCQSKSNMPKLIIIFKQLGIPVYAIWDNDKNGDRTSIKKENRILLKLLDAPEKDYPFGVESNYTCFDNKIETMLNNEIPSEIYDKLICDIKFKYNIRTFELKSGNNMSIFLNELSKLDVQFPSMLLNIVKKIDELFK